MDTHSEPESKTTHGETPIWMYEAGQVAAVCHIMDRVTDCPEARTDNRQQQQHNGHAACQNIDNLYARVDQFVIVLKIWGALSYRRYSCIQSLIRNEDSIYATYTYAYIICTYVG